MEPGVVNKTDDAMVGRKAPKYFFVCPGKWRGRGGLRTGQIFDGISLLETIESRIIIRADSFSALVSLARDNSVIFFSLPQRRRCLSGCNAKQMPVKLLTPLSRVKGVAIRTHIFFFFFLRVWGMWLVCAETEHCILGSSSVCEYFFCTLYLSATWV